MRTVRVKLWLAVSLATVFAITTVVPAGASASSASGRHHGPNHAGITRIDIDKVEPAFGGMTFGAVGSYERLSGTAYGKIDPADAANQGLAYLDNAPRDKHGLINYSMDFAMLRPANTARGNGKIFYEVINRGHVLSLGILNQGSETDPGNGFLMRQGYEIVWAGWQPDADPNTATYQAHFPVAKHPDGRPIVKPTMMSLVPDSPETGAGDTQTVVGNILTADIAYAPTSRNVARANTSLTVRERYRDDPVRLDPSAVTFLPHNRVSIDMTQAVGMGFDQGAIYELTYDGKDPWVGGVGFASTRDLVSYLHQQPLGSTGPDSHHSSHRSLPREIYGWGDSQDGRFLKDFIWQGFNTDLAGRKVFDGVMALVSGAKKTDHNAPDNTAPFAQTSRWIRDHEDHNYPGGAFPFTYKTLHDPLTGKTDGILRQCTADGTCPKIFHIDSDFETWNGHMSLVTTDTTGHPVALPDNVRAFQISGQSHGAGNGTPRDLPNCKWQSNPLDGRPVYRALVVDMDQWVSEGVAPPASKFPNLTNGTLQTPAQAAASWPSIPGLPFSDNMIVANVGDYSVQPPTFGNAYPIFLPTTDSLGNPQGGVITPDLVAPLGTYMGRNFRKAGHAENELCGGTGGFAPLAATAATKAQGDSRPALDELYPGGQAQFLAARAQGVDALIAQRLVLPAERLSYTNEVSFPR